MLIVVAHYPVLLGQNPRFDQLGFRIISLKFSRSAVDWAVSLVFLTAVSDGVSTTKEDGEPVTTKRKSRVTKEDAQVTLDTRAFETFARLEAQSDYLDIGASPDTSPVPAYRLAAMEKELGDLRQLVSHLVLVMRREGIHPFKYAKKVNL